MANSSIANSSIANNRTRNKTAENISSENKMDYNYYYKLKQKYQDQLETRKTIIKENRELTLAEKKSRIKRIIPRCVACGKKGGTTFEEKNNMLKAVCAARDQQCDLNVAIKRKVYDNVRDLFHKNEKTIDNLKMRIIMTKLDYLFGYNTTKDDVVDKFNNLKQELAAITETQLINNKKYYDIISGIHREPLLLDAKNDLLSEIENMKEIYSQYKEEPVPQLIKAMIETYKDNILPLSEKIRKMNYQYYALETNEDEDKDISKLIMQPYLYAQLEQERK
jgi:hypothetical protein